MKGTLVSIGKSSLVLSHPDTGDPETTHAVAKGCKFFLNGIQCRLNDLAAGDEIELDADPASEVKAERE